jgi:O-antigen ligase
MAARARLWVFPSILLASAALLGVVATISPAIALGAVAGIVFAYIVFSDLAAGFAILGFLAFLDILPTSGSLSPSKAAGLLIAVAWLARASTQERGTRDFFADFPSLSWVMIGFIGWAALTLLWASQTGAGITALSRYVPNMLLLPIACTALRGRRDIKIVLAAIIIGAILAAAFGLIEPPNPAIAEERATGTVGDPNELAAALLVGLALGAGFVLARGLSVRLRLLGLFAVPLCAAGIFLSLSRGGLIALAAVLLAGTIFAGRWRMAVTATLVVVAFSGFLYFTAIAGLPARERVTTAAGGSGRSDLWKVGLRMVQAHPIEGVGVGNFQAVSGNYVLQPGTLERTDLIFAAEPKVTHNTYLQVMAETGVPGFLLFLAILVSCLVCALRAASIWAKQNETALEAFARGLVLALVGIFVADFFISQMYSKLLWALLALGPAMLAIARREASSSNPLASG